MMSLFLSMGFINMINPTEEVYAYGMTAAGTNDYTTWKQTSSSWGEATPWSNASIPKFGDAGCWITSVAILLRHYNVVTDSNVNTFNNRSKNSLTSIGDGMNCTFEHVCSNS